jgi:ABC-type hemin transport system ATPase subunit
VKVIAAAALTSDIAVWADGDMFAAGEDGQALSGGQRARVGLARALYSRSPILLVCTGMQTQRGRSCQDPVGHFLYTFPVSQSFVENGTWPMPVVCADGAR